jgi:Leucine-rich repeat (LRR) protein
MSTVARSLREIFAGATKGKLASFHHISLCSSPDLICNNLFCENVTGPCICRLERALEQVNLESLKYLDLRGNGLSALPPSVARMHNLEEIDLQGNSFNIKPAVLDDLPNLKVVRLDGNPLTT